MSGGVKIYGGGAGFEPGIVTTFPANVVPYINGSKTTAYDSTFTYQSGQLGIGIASSLGATLHVKGANDSSESAAKIQTSTYEVLNIYNNRKIVIGGGSTVAGTDYIINAFGTGSSNTDVILTINGAGNHNVFRFGNTGGATRGGLEIQRSAISASLTALAIYGGSTSTLAITSDGAITWTGPRPYVDSALGGYIQYSDNTNTSGVPGMLYNVVGTSIASHVFKKGRSTMLPGTGPVILTYANYTDSGINGTSDNHLISVKPTINLTGTGTKNIVGFYYSPTVTSLTGGGRHFSAVFEAGNVLIGAAIASGNASAALQIVSTTQGFLPPVMTGAQAEAISGPTAGLLVYASSGTGVTITTTGWWGYNGSTWVKLN